VVEKKDYEREERGKMMTRERKDETMVIGRPQI